jgi:hypothetical protein
MTRRLGFLLAALLSCPPLLGCSNNGAGPSGPLGTDGGSSSTTLDPTVATGLQQLVSQGQKYSNYPTDSATAKVAAQIVQLLFDRAASLGTAANIAATEADPSYTGNKAYLETSRQASLTRAASDLAQIQTLQQSSVPGSVTLNADGGAVGVINAIVVEAFAARASAILASKKPPSTQQISDFLQEVAVVLGDQGNDGHDVAAQLVAQAILSDAGLVRTDAGAP